jgi:hypothetical protein
MESLQAFAERYDPEDFDYAHVLQYGNQEQNVMIKCILASHIYSPSLYVLRFCPFPGIFFGDICSKSARYC